MTRPVSSAAGIAVYQCQPWLVSRMAMTAPHTPLAKPADRSISPSSRTKTRPIAMKMTAAPWENRLAKLSALKNVSPGDAEDQAEHDQAEDGRQAADVAAADPAPVVVDVARRRSV